MALGQDDRDPVWDDEEREPDIWQRLSRFTLICILLVVVFGSVLVLRPHFEAQRGEAARARALEETKAIYERLLVKRQKELHWLRTDLNYLEKVARDRLVRAKPGEYVIRVQR